MKSPQGGGCAQLKRCPLPASGIAPGCGVWDGGGSVREAIGKKRVWAEEVSTVSG